MLRNPDYHDDATALRQNEYAEIKKNYNLLFNPVPPIFTKLELLRTN